MDKLDKVPTDKALAVRPITQGVISNTIFQVAWNGASAVIGLLTRHYALIYGIPPFWAIFFGVVAFFLMALSINLMRRRKEAKALSSAKALEPVAKAQLQLAPEKPKPKLTFDFDENESSATVNRDGSHVSRITADIKVRCEKETDSPMIVRALHLALYRLEKDGTSTLIPYQEEKQISWEYSNGRLVPFSDGWTIDKPRSEYRFYNVVIEITPKAQAELSSDHFLQFTMDAIGQDEVSKAIYVRNWSEPNSPISLKPFEIFSPGAQKELTRLHKQLRSYEKTNEDLGRRLSQSDKTHKAEVKEVRLALRTNERELEDTGKRVNELKNEKQALDGALQNAEKQISQWEWLTSQAEQQKTAISEHIKVSVELGDMILTGLNPTVRFGIKIVNKSFLDISLAPNLDEHVNGKIAFTGYQSITLHGSKIVLYTAKDIPPGGDGHLTIEQRLIDNDPRIINDDKGWPDGRFDLSALDIEIVGGKHTPDITGMPLEMKNVTVSAFSPNLLERGQRIRAMAEVRGSAEQLHEALRVAEKPLPKEVFEHWEAASRSFLEKVYEPAALIRVWEQITDQTPIPGTAPSQRAWLSSRIVKMGAFLAELTGEYVNRRTLNS